MTAKSVLFYLFLVLALVSNASANYRNFQFKQQHNFDSDLSSAETSFNEKVVL